MAASGGPWQACRAHVVKAAAWRVDVAHFSTTTCLLTGRGACWASLKSTFLVAHDLQHLVRRLHGTCTSKAAKVWGQAALCEPPHCMKSGAGRQSAVAQSSEVELGCHHHV